MVTCKLALFVVAVDCCVLFSPLFVIVIKEPGLKTVRKTLDVW